MASSIRVSSVLLALGLGTAALFPAESARAALSISAVQGGGPTGTLRFNFDDLTAGSSSPQTTSSIGGGIGLTVQFSGAGGIASGPSSAWVQPFLSGLNGNGFGPGGTNQALGADATAFLTSGSSAAVPGSQVSLALPAPATYFGLLWGSIEDANILRLLSNGLVVGELTGADVTAMPNGDAGVSGTRYVNINSTVAFDTVVFSSRSASFEFDNVALVAPTPIPVPGTAALLGAGLAGLAWTARRRKG